MEGKIFIEELVNGNVGSQVWLHCFRFRKLGG